MASLDGKVFKPDLETPLYRQLYHHLQAAILSGELRGGTKLPSTRALTDELGVSRNTVLNAYEQLIVEGYLETIAAKGTYVVHVLPESLLTADAPPPVASKVSEVSTPRFSSRAARQLDTPPLASSGRLATPFSISTPALDAFPYQTWSRLVARRARCLAADDLKYQAPAGYRPLREAIAAHVTLSRQVHCSAEQVVIVAGSQGGFDLTSRVLLDAGDEVWLEDPGYLGARGAVLGAGAAIVPVPVDTEGLVVEAGIARAPQARLAYVTPSHQSPLGVTMSVARRLALLEWAGRADAYILEDDYDSEYRYTGRPLPALQALDETGRVIYVGSFSKVLFPSLRIGFLILPPPLLGAFVGVRSFVDSQPAMLEQLVLTDFMVEGHFARHLRRMRKLYAERRTALLAELERLPLEVDSPAAGLHCVGWLAAGVDDVAVVDKAAEHGLELWSVSHHSLEPMKRKGLLLGFANADPAAMRDGVRRLEAALGSL